MKPLKYNARLTYSKLDSVAVLKLRKLKRELELELGRPTFYFCYFKVTQQCRAAGSRETLLFRLLFRRSTKNQEHEVSIVFFIKVY